MRRFPLEPGRDEMEEMGQAALAFVERFVEDRASAPAADLEGAVELGEQLASRSPGRARPFEELLGVLEAGAAKALDTAGPGYLAFIPGGGLFTAAVADLLACTINRYVGLVMTAPALVGLEASLLRWLCELFDLPPTARGILTSGGSMSNLSAIVTARLALLGDDFLRGTLYVTDHTHRSVAKAARLAGFPAGNVRVVASTTELTMDPEALRAAVRADRAARMRPCCVVATAGTTSTGAIDPLPEVGAVARAEGLWLHVDAAYGGFFQLTERGRARLAGIEHADSITLDPHKGLFLPYGTGCLLVRDGQQLRRAHQVEASYLQDLAADEMALPNFADYSPELSREFRGLRMWLPLHYHGLDAFRAALDEKLDLTAVLQRALQDDPNLEVPWEAPLSIVAFRRRGGGDSDQLRLLERINASRRIVLSSTLVDRRVALRACILSHRTHRDRLEEAIRIIRQAVDQQGSDGL